MRPTLRDGSTETLGGGVKPRLYIANTQVSLTFARNYVSTIYPKSEIKEAISPNSIVYMGPRRGHLKKMNTSEFRLIPLLRSLSLQFPLKIQLPIRTRRLLSLLFLLFLPVWCRNLSWVWPRPLSGATFKQRHTTSTK